MVLEPGQRRAAMQLGLAPVVEAHHIQRLHAELLSRLCDRCVDERDQLLGRFRSVHIRSAHQLRHDAGGVQPPFTHRAQPSTDPLLRELIRVRRVEGAHPVGCGVEQHCDRFLLARHPRLVRRAVRQPELDGAESERRNHCRLERKGQTKLPNQEGMEKVRGGHT